MFALVATPDGVEIPVKVVPGASRDRIVGVLGDALKVQVAAPPEKGKANKALTAVLARQLGVACKQVTVVRGQTNPQKTVRVRGLSADELWTRLELG